MLNLCDAISGSVSADIALLYNLKDNQRSCKGHIKNGLHAKPVLKSRMITVYTCLLQGTMIHSSTMTPCTHRQTYLHQSVWPPHPPSPLCNMHNASFVLYAQSLQHPQHNNLHSAHWNHAWISWIFQSCVTCIFRRTDRIQTALAEWLLLVCVTCVYVYL